MGCKRERDEILNNFITSKELIEITTLSKEELKNVNFTNKSSDLLVETIKALIISYCNDNTEIKTIQNINKIIQD